MPGVGGVALVPPEHLHQGPVRPVADGELPVGQARDQRVDHLRAAVPPQRPRARRPDVHGLVVHGVALEGPDGLVGGVGDGRPGSASRGGHHALHLHGDVPPHDLGAVVERPDKRVPILHGAGLAKGPRRGGPHARVGVVLQQGAVGPQVGLLPAVVRARERDHHLAPHVGVGRLHHHVDALRRGRADEPLPDEVRQLLVSAPRRQACENAQDHGGAPSVGRHVAPSAPWPPPAAVLSNSSVPT